MKIRHMRTIGTIALLAGSALATAFWPSSSDGVEAAAPAVKAAVPVNPDREAYFGDLHLHTEYSSDAFVLMGTRVGPEDAYRFASGQQIDYLGKPVQRRWPLDFMAVTDHAENIGFVNKVAAESGRFGGDLLYDSVMRGGLGAYRAIRAWFDDHASERERAEQQRIGTDAWQNEVAIAERFNQPGKFTTFAGYEFTSSPGGANLHRNVIFRDKAPEAPFSAADSDDPADLWKFLNTIRGRGIEALSITHNGNASNGLMYDWTTLDGRPLDRAAATLRAQNEPLAEISQGKGQSETVPALSANDEFASFEVFDQLLVSPTKSKPQGSYVRDALGRGLVIEQKLGVNPYKLGVVGGSDYHSGLSNSLQSEYAGEIGRANLGGGKASKQSAKYALGLEVNPQAWDGFKQIITTAGNLTGVWAESNTRASIYAALRRRETFATSGSRIRVRFFGGWNLPVALLRQGDWVRAAYGTGVPMGSDLPASGAGKSPQFLVQAAKDPNGANLDRIQVIKVWVEGGQHREKVFDAVWSGSRRVDAGTGKLAAVGNTVDLKTGKYRNSIGAATLSGGWSDPEFDARRQAAYYVRVLEIPTPRWSTLLAIAHGLPLPKDVAVTVQQRAWSSAIWYGGAAKP